MPGKRLHPEFLSDLRYSPLAWHLFVFPIRISFPQDFMFQLSDREVRNLRSQIGISSSDYGGRRYLPLVFTEQGIAMLSAVLRSKQAVRVNIEIMRTFVKLREFISSNRDLARKLADLEQRYDQQFKVVFDAIREIMLPKELPKKRRIGFGNE